MRFFALALVIVSGLLFCAGGWFLMDHPKGDRLFFSLNALQNTSFSDFFWPGLMLFLFYGLGSLLVAGLIFQRSTYYPRGIMVLGGLMLAGIILQVLFLPLPAWVQIVHGILGLLLIGSGYWLSRFEPDEAF